MFGMALNRPSLADKSIALSLTMQLIHGTNVFADTSSNYYDNIQPYNKRRFCFFFVKCDTLLDFFLGNYHNFILLIFAR